MATIPPIFTNLISLLFLLLLHLGCFFLFPSSGHHRRRPKPSSPIPLLRPTTTTTPKPNKPFSTSTTWSFIKHFFSISNSNSKPETNSIIHHVPPSPASSTRSLYLHNPSVTRPGSLTESDFLPLRNDIYPCPNCGEIFHKPNSLEQHQAFKHAVSELFDDDPGKNIVRIIFQTGWPEPGSGHVVGPGSMKSPMVYRVMKINNCAKILTRFEEYRESVKSKAVKYGGGRRGTVAGERCIADGNELLRFHCATFLCDLGQNGNSSVCSHQYCSVCGIIRVGFSAKMDGISTYSTSWKAHVAVPEDIEEEFRFMHVKRAMLVCRVIAGRVGCDLEMGDKDDPGYDSLVGREHGEGEDELIVFNPSAVLPCFVIAYSV